MRFLFAAIVLAGLACAAGALADPADPLAATDPSNTSGWHPPPSPTADLKPYRPVEAKNWFELNKAAGSGSGSMKGMPGMGSGK